MNDVGESIWIVEGLDCCGGTCDTIEGYAMTKEEAETIAAKLNAESEKRIALWNQHCVNCGVECDEFATKEAAAEELKKIMRDAKCGCAAVKTVEEDGRFHIVCDAYSCVNSYDYKYIVREVKRLRKD